MCGIFGSIKLTPESELPSFENFLVAGKLSERRGKDASGMAVCNSGGNYVLKHPQRFTHLVKQERSKFIRWARSNSRNAVAHIGHTRMVTHGSRLNQDNNQPIQRDGVLVFHNGIILNSEAILESMAHYRRNSESDSEAIIALYLYKLRLGLTPESAFVQAANACDGGNTFVIFDLIRKFLGLHTTTGSLYIIQDKGVLHFASEPRVLETLAKSPISPKKALPGFFKTEFITAETHVDAWENYSFGEHTKLMELDNTPDKVSLINFRYSKHALSSQRRCSKCVIPETYPGIAFNESGVCSICTDLPQPVTPKYNQLEEFRRRLSNASPEKPILVPFSGGRDSTYIIYMLSRAWGLPVVAFTYDWGFVTDRARRNISRVCGELGVEHILVAADIDMKRSNVRKNITAWSHDPDLALIPLFMAGDKHFFEVADHLKQERNCHSVVFGMNRLEQTVFKAALSGTRGSKRSDKTTYHLELKDKLRMIFYYLKSFAKNPRYINRSLLDTLRGFRSFYARKETYENFFDYVEWDEDTVNSVNSLLGWESSEETDNTWRVGDATASFYNYAYQYSLGFNELDTFRSNQIRSGQISRDQAMDLLNEESKPRVSDFNDYAAMVGIAPTDLLAYIHKLNPRFST